MPTDLHIRGTVVIPGDDLSWRAVRASGPGGQHVNKVSTKVELRFDLAGTSAIHGRVKARLRRLAPNRIDSEGQLVITSQLTRNRVRNLEDARHKLALLILDALPEPKSRRPTRPTRSSQRRRLDHKRRQSDKKQRRRKLGSGDV
ncbi:MAG: aminoacyl-tRNA hydrolase [Deltaproteobacteria bacterium]|nr:aminoacyl-tRNA hydrolase [Deltaproteobacteria bacterium]